MDQLARKVRGLLRLCVCTGGTLVYCPTTPLTKGPWADTQTKARTLLIAQITIEESFLTDLSTKSNKSLGRAALCQKYHRTQVHRDVNQAMTRIRPLFPEMMVSERYYAPLESTGSPKKQKLNENIVESKETSHLKNLHKITKKHASKNSG